ncbi:MAG: hypothetical protein WCS37_04265 [Chloroflexota bacterium]|nr:hypothetical protein [Chloroflexota bacterium]
MKSINDLVKGCREQTELYSQHGDYDPRDCFELWRRAIVDRDESAWTALVEQYSNFVQKWILQRLGSTSSIQVERDVLMNGAFFNMYRSLSPEKFTSFTNLPAILKYLKMCCWTIVTDYLRDWQERRFDVSLDPSLDQEEGGNTPLEVLPLEGTDLVEVVLDRVDRPAFWNLVWSRLESPSDQRLVYLRYVLDMPPREIVLLYPREYPTVQEVYRRNKNLLWRLRNTKLNES